MNRVGAIAALLAIVFVLFACASSGQTGSGGSSENTKQIKGRSFEVEGGEVHIQDAIVEYYSFLGSISKLKGTIVNKTDRAYKSVEFRLEVINDSILVSSEDIEVFTVKGRRYLMPEDSMSFDKSLFVDVENPSEKNYDVSGLEGSFPVEYEFQMISPDTSRSITHVTEDISLDFSIERNEIGFNINNKSDKPVSIIWNKASYVDTEGSSQGVMHEGVKYSNRDQSLPPTTIPPGASKTDVIVPTDYVRYDDMIDDWTTEPFFPDGEGAESYEGKTFSVFLPLEVGEETKNLNFEFKITGVSPVGI